MGNKKYLIFIAVVIFSVVLFSDKARAECPNSCQVAPCSAIQDQVLPPAGDCGSAYCCVPKSGGALPTCDSLNGDCVPLIGCYNFRNSKTDCNVAGATCCIQATSSILPGKTCSYLGGSCVKNENCVDNFASDKATDCASPNVCCISKEKLTTPTPPPTTTPPAGTTTEFANPIACKNAQCLLIGLLKTLQGVVAIIAIVMIVIGGIMYMFAGVNEKSVELAKKMIGGAVIGLAIVVAAPAFLKELLAVLGGSGVDDSGLLSSAPSVKTIAERILQLVLSIAGILGIIGLIIGGGYYMTSYGDEDRMKKGKMVIGASLTGIVFALAALVIVRQIAVLLGQ